MDWRLLAPGEPSGCEREHSTTRHKSDGDTLHGGERPSSPERGHQQTAAFQYTCSFAQDNPVGNSCYQERRLNTLHLPQLGRRGHVWFRNPAVPLGCSWWVLVPRGLDAVVSLGKISEMVRCALNSKSKQEPKDATRGLFLPPFASPAQGLAPGQPEPAMAISRSANRLVSLTKMLWLPADN